LNIIHLNFYCYIKIYGVDIVDGRVRETI
jgi:hypothetical protein